MVQSCPRQDDDQKVQHEDVDGEEVVEEKVLNHVLVGAHASIAAIHIETSRTQAACHSLPERRLSLPPLAGISLLLSSIWCQERIRAARKEIATIRQRFPEHWQGQAYPCRCMRDHASLGQTSSVSLMAIKSGRSHLLLASPMCTPSSMSAVPTMVRRGS